MSVYPAPVIVVDDFIGKGEAEQLFQYAHCPRIRFPAAALHLPTGGSRSVVGCARILVWGDRIMEASAVEFRKKWYVVERAVVDAASLCFLYGHALALADKGRIPLGDPQVADAPVAYSDPHMDALLERVRGKMEQATGVQLWPTYSYLRVYKRGNVLKAHRDRPASEISMTLNLGMSAGEPWPIWIAGPQGIASVSLNPGDGLIYRGCDCYHWREPFAGNHQAQIFLHYVDRNGPNAEWKYDKRPHLSRLPDESQSVRPFGATESQY